MCHLQYQLLSSCQNIVPNCSAKHSGNLYLFAGKKWKVMVRYRLLQRQQRDSTEWIKGNLGWSQISPFQQSHTRRAGLVQNWNTWMCLTMYWPCCHRISSIAALWPNCMPIITVWPRFHSLGCVHWWVSEIKKTWTTTKTAWKHNVPRFALSSDWVSQLYR